jgi:DNA-binding transcriptional regulator LsrR (DeoR family)
MPNFHEDYSSARLISRILSMYYLENNNQAEIGKELGLSTAKVNRMLKQARAQGLIEIRLHTPFQHLFELERKLEKLTNLQEAVVIPKLAADNDTTLQRLGKAAADYFLEHLHDGDVVCLSGGEAIFNLVNAIETDRRYDVFVIPAIGGVQGRHYTDVNFLATELAKRIGGNSYELHAPAIVDTTFERDALFSLRHVKEIIDMARRATIALVGVGSLIPETSSYFQFTAMSQEEMHDIIEKNRGVGQVLAHVFDVDGNECAQEYSDRLIGMNLEDLKKVPLIIGTAGLAHKVSSVYGALSGGYLKTLVTDEEVALGVIRMLEERKKPVPQPMLP